MTFTSWDQVKKAHYRKSIPFLEAITPSLLMSRLVLETHHGKYTFPIYLHNFDRFINILFAHLSPNVLSDVEKKHIESLTKTIKCVRRYSKNRLFVFFDNDTEIALAYTDTFRVFIVIEGEQIYKKWHPEMLLGKQVNIEFEYKEESYRFILSPRLITMECRLFKNNQLLSKPLKMPPWRSRGIDIN